MYVQSVIEIAETDGQLPVEIIIKGYRLSQKRLTVFILNEVTPAAVNRVLDPVVPTLPLLIPGVLYVKMSDGARVREAVEAAEVVYAATAMFRDLLTGYGILPCLLRSIETLKPDSSKRVRLVTPGEQKRGSSAPKGQRRTITYLASLARSYLRELGSA
ncbi:MAG TPA: hypothetical protein VGO04_22575 [Ensifer sp.]|jgi:hypothetical protein|uniref:hypothetical protein n=1 Tax=Ensifer sp. TaxID=1872086 RepID=UPI002E0F1149|nr:hypothetical protein [Ensifer sp.]